MASPHRYRARAIVYLFGISAFLLATVIAVLSARGYTIDFTKGTVAKSGLLVVNSTPGNAFVTINNELREPRTAARLRLRPNRYTVKVDKPGVVPWQKQLDVETGEAVFEDNIILFLQNPPSHTLGESVAVHRLAPDGRTVAYVQNSPTGPALMTTTLVDGSPVKLADLPASYATPSGLAVSDDSSRMVVTAGNQAMVVPLGGGSPVTATVPGPAVFAPGSRDELLVTLAGPNQLRRVSLNAPETSELVAENFTVADVTASGAYLAGPDGGLRRYNQADPSQRPLQSGTPLTDIAAASNAEVVLGRDTGRTLRIFTAADAPRTIAEQVEAYRPNPDASWVAYVANRELHLWERTTGEDFLLTRFAEPIIKILPFSDGDYVLYEQAGSVHAIARDGTNDVTLTQTGTTPLTVGDRDTLLRLDANGILSAIRLVER